MCIMEMICLLPTHFVSGLNFELITVILFKLLWI